MADPAMIAEKNCQSLPPTLLSSPSLIPSIIIPMTLSEFSENLSDPKHVRGHHYRKWTKAQVESMYETATNYLKDKNLKIEQLTLEDFETIAIGRPQSSKECMSKFFEVTKSGSFKAGIWPENEDEILKELTLKKLSWTQIAKILNEKIHNSRPVRNGKQCKERWANHVNPNIRKGPWNESEDILLLETYKEHGKIWNKMFQVFPERTESAVKNRLKSLIISCKQDIGSLNNLCRAIDRMIEKKREKVEDDMEECIFGKYQENSYEPIDFCSLEKKREY